MWQQAWLWREKLSSAFGWIPPPLTSGLPLWQAPDILGPQFQAAESGGEVQNIVYSVSQPCIETSTDLTTNLLESLYDRTHVIYEMLIYDQSQRMGLDICGGWKWLSLTCHALHGSEASPTEVKHNEWVRMRNEFPPQGWQDRVNSYITWEELEIELLVLNIERSLVRWLGHLYWMHPRCLPWEVFSGMSRLEET